MRAIIKPTEIPLERMVGMEELSQFILQNLPAILCLISGFALVVVEMFIPGFGLPGISGIILLVVGVALKANSALEALIIAEVIILLLCVALSISLQAPPRGDYRAHRWC